MTLEVTNTGGSVVNDDEGSGHAERRTGAWYMEEKEGRNRGRSNNSLVDQAGPRTRSSEATPEGWMISNGGWKDHEV